MKASELRIGNLVQDKISKQIGVVDIINKKRVVVSLIGDCYANEIQPIPLTEEWLIKFGFEEDYQNDFMIFFNGRTYYYNLKSGFLMKDYKIKAKLNQFPIKHVNQLQNLYFALTGEELELFRISIN